MSATELKEMKGDLQRQKIALEEGLKQGSAEMDKWVELTEQAFDFARYARVWFEHGDEETKKAILGCLGSNLIVKDQKLNVHLHPFFLNMLESKEKVEAQVASARTSENAVLERQKGTFVPSCPDLLALLNQFRTFDWAEEYKYPTVILSQMKELLAEQQEG